MNQCDLWTNTNWKKTKLILKLYLKNNGDMKCILIICTSWKVLFLILLQSSFICMLLCWWGRRPYYLASESDFSNVVPSLRILQLFPVRGKVWGLPTSSCCQLIYSVACWPVPTLSAIRFYWHSLRDSNMPGTTLSTLLVLSRVNIYSPVTEVVIILILRMRKQKDRKVICPRSCS